MIKFHSLFIVLFAFIFYICLSLYFLSILPEIKGKENIQIPRSLSSAQELVKIFDDYIQSHFYTMIFGFSLIYSFLQCFSIPGSSFMNCCAGALFGLFNAFWLCTINATIGASLAYGLSLFIGSGIVNRFFPSKKMYFKSEVDKHRDSLFYYLLFLRITPLLPNWFINLSSPVISISFIPFCIATFIGVMPQTFLQVEIGLTLIELDPNKPFSFINIKTILLLLAIGSLALLPSLYSMYKKYSKEKQK